jgi:UMP-CMP kinase
MSKHDKEKNIFIIDGFPRNEENYSGFCDTLKDNAHILSIVFLECPEEVCNERIIKRSELSGRVDDNKGSLVKRFNTFNQETIPLIDEIEKAQKIKIVKINANQSKDEVFNCVALELDKIILKN